MFYVYLKYSSLTLKRQVVVGLALKGLILPYAVRVIMINYTRMQSMLESPFGTTLKELE